MFFSSILHSRLFQPFFRPSALSSFAFPFIWSSVQLSLPVIDTWWQWIYSTFRMMRCVVASSSSGFCYFRSIPKRFDASSTYSAAYSAHSMVPNASSTLRVWYFIYLLNPISIQCWEPFCVYIPFELICICVFMHAGWLSQKPCLICWTTFILWKSHKF